MVAKYYVEIYHSSQIQVLMAQKSETHQLQVRASQSSKDLTQTELGAWMMSGGTGALAPTWRLVTPPVGHITCLPMCGHTIA